MGLVSRLADRQMDGWTDRQTVLGTPVGCDSFVSKACAEIAEAGENLCQRMKDLDDPQSALLLLRYCHVPRLKGELQRKNNLAPYDSSQ